MQLSEGQGNPKEDAAQTLSNLSQAPFGQQLPVHYAAGASGGGLPGINDPGPSSHPRGPPNLGQLSAVAMQAAPVSVPPSQGQPGRPEEGAAPGSQVPNAAGPSTGATEAAGQANTSTQTASNTSTGSRRGANRAAMGTDEWTRQRKDNHVRAQSFSWITFVDLFTERS